jgi:hypothetical protein
VVFEDLKSKWTIAGQQAACNQPARSRVETPTATGFGMAGNVFHLPMEVFSILEDLQLYQLSSICSVLM